MLLVVTSLVVGVASAANVDPGGALTPVGGGVSIRVPAGWHVIRRWSEITYPIPRLAIASFPARLSRHPCECGMPNIRDFPRDGAFLTVWESHLQSRMRARFPVRPTRFRLTPGTPTRYTCRGPSDEIAFRDAGRLFVAEIYLGPATGPKTQARILATLDSLRVAQRPR